MGNKNTRYQTNIMADETDQNEVNTQETERICSQLTPLTLEEEDETIWGWLHPTSDFNFEPLALQNDSYTLGRSPKCDMCVREEHFNNTNNLTISVISKVQFRIFKEILSSETEVIHLEDLSMNGTFVNKKRVGKGKKEVLNNGDEIALANPHSKVYIFVKSSVDKSWIPAEMKALYSIKVPLGSGAYGVVKLAQNKVTSKLVAIKKVKKTEGKEQQILNEVKILQNLKHPCVVSMEAVFDTPDSLFIVLEYISGGELATRIRQVTRLSDWEAKCIFYQLVLALQYLHRKGVAHRDLKPENILLSLNSNDGGKLVKVSDFGLSKLADSKTNLDTFCGTIMYTAPEVLLTKDSGPYTHQVDVWSLGVILFQCMSGKLPFNTSRSPMSVVEQIVRASYSMTGPGWKGVSPQAASLVRRMLKADPSQRITIDQILEHPWLQDKEMRSKVKSLMDTKSPCGDENLCVGYMRPAKRQRLEEDDTVLRS